MSNLAGCDSCVGCTACANVCPKHCIKIEKDTAGFGYPKVTLSDCIDCGICENVCPTLNEVLVGSELPAVYAAISSDEVIRKNSSSGGIFTELAKKIISQNGVVYGAAYNEKFEVYHCCVDNIDDLKKLRGAKYSESNLGDTFVSILGRLQQGQKILFSGTPCQVAGLKAFLKKDYENLYCVDFVCHGVPSPMAWKAYVEYRAKTDNEGKLPCYINLRSKCTGWSRYQYSNVFKYKDGKIYSALSSQSLFMKLFVGDYISRRSCSECKFKGYNRVSDITLGDFWGIWDIYPEIDDNKGTSVVLLQSQKGKQLWNEINDQLFFKKVTLEQASRCNPSMLKSSKANDNREKVLELIRNGKIDDCEKLFYLKSPSFKDKIKRKVRRIISKL